MTKSHIFCRLKSRKKVVKMSYLKSLFIIISILTSIFLTGCSARTHLGYTPIYSEIKPRPNSLVLSSFEDVRAKKEVVGSKKNTYGIPVVTIYAENSVADWVTDALKSELVRAGYTFENINENENYEIVGTIKKLHASSYINYRGKIIVEISVIKDNQKFFEKIYETNLKTGISFLAKTDQVAKALEVNLQEICKQFINDLNQL